MKADAKLEMKSGKEFKTLPPIWTAGLSVWLAAGSAFCATLTNCTEADLRAAMVGGGTVTFACDGMIVLSNTIVVATNTSLDAGGHEITISGGNAVRVFYVNSNVTFSAVHLAITAGYSSNGAGIFNHGGSVVLTEATVHGNLARGGSPDIAEGGAIYNKAGTVNATNCVLADNSANQVTYIGLVAQSQARGGAICNRSGVVNFQKCVFTGNSAQGDSTPGPNLYATPGQQGAGGVIYSDGMTTVNECAFTSNSAVGGDGGSYMIVSGPGQPGGSGEGGAIYNLGTLSAYRCKFMDNYAGGGNGGTSIGGPFSPGYPLPGYGGQAGGSGVGGAIFNQGIATLSASTFNSNHCYAGSGGNGGNAEAPVLGYPGGNGGGGGAGGSGDGAALFNAGSAMLINDTFANNTASGNSGGQGGNGSSSSTSTMPGGNGGSGGYGGNGCGGISDASGLLMTNCTMAFNSGTGSQGGLGGYGGSGGPGGPPGSPGLSGANGRAAGGLKTFGGLLINTLLSTNNPGSNCLGTITDAGHNLSSDTSCAFTNSGSLNNTDPKLGLLADNGGPTLTVALLPGSPAIDTGDNSVAPPVDQRGYPRPAGSGADIGAFEYGSMLPFLSISCTTPGVFEIVAQGNTNQPCRLLTSTNLCDWCPLATNQFGANGKAFFSDSGAPGVFYRFYRIVMP